MEDSLGDFSKLQGEKTWRKNERKTRRMGRKWTEPIHWNTKITTTTCFGHGHVTIDPIEGSLRTESKSSVSLGESSSVRFFWQYLIISLKPLLDHSPQLSLFSALKEVLPEVWNPRDQASFIVLRRRENRYLTLISARWPRKGHLIVSSLPIHQRSLIEEQFKKSGDI